MLQNSAGLLQGHAGLLQARAELLQPTTGLLRGNEAVGGGQTATVEVNGEGFQPSTLKLKAGVPAKVTFVRKTDETCAKEVVIKDYNIDRKLPLNEPVTVEFTPRKGEFVFACGMDMLKGKLIVE
jgi:plastocyanin domain-containing protein